MFRMYCGIMLKDVYEHSLAAYFISCSVSSDLLLSSSYILIMIGRHSASG